MNWAVKSSWVKASELGPEPMSEAMTLFLLEQEMASDPVLRSRYEEYLALHEIELQGLNHDEEGKRWAD